MLALEIQLFNDQTLFHYDLSNGIEPLETQHSRTELDGDLELEAEGHLGHHILASTGIDILFVTDSPRR